jgi:heme/copper-type cytochrome/quinol oxidase subunit 2
MNDSDRKEGVNYPLLLAVILIIGVAIGVVAMKVLDSRPDMKVVTVKMSGEQLTEFAAHVEKMVARYRVRMDEKGLPIVHPPAGSDVYILARNYDFGKFTLELEKDKSYRLKLASEDIKHSIIVRELKLRNRINAGEISTIEFRPEKAGTFDVVCGEYCGIGHGSMVGRLIVTE